MLLSHKTNCHTFTILFILEETTLDISDLDVVPVEDFIPEELDNDFLSPTSSSTTTTTTKTKTKTLKVLDRRVTF